MNPKRQSRRQTLLPKKPEDITAEILWRDREDAYQRRWITWLLRLLNSDGAFISKPKADLAELRTAALRLISAAREATELLEGMPALDLWEGPYDPERRMETTEFPNKLIADFRLRPVLSITADGRALSLEYWPTAFEKGQTQTDYIPAMGILTLIQQGRFDRLRECRNTNCKNGATVDGIAQPKWLLAERADKSTCSPACRMRIHSETAGYKDKRATYLQDRNQGRFLVKKRGQPLPSNLSVTTP